MIEGSRAEITLAKLKDLIGQARESKRLAIRSALIS
jgi:hypothetical protein